MKKFKFVDLFAGIGGFHQAMTNLGGTCVFASEIDVHARETYEANYGIKPFGDIRDIDPERDVPTHDVLCAGFPCQTFSKAGNRHGLEDSRGTLFFDIARILQYHKSEYIVLENVRNLISHDDGNTWEVISSTLHELGYRLTDNPLVLSPHHFGVPQTRERIIILGKYEPDNVSSPLDISIDDLMLKKDNSIYSILESDNQEETSQLSDKEKEVLRIWNDFYQGIKERTIGFPIWIDYFDKTSDNDMPKWKKNFILKNNQLYINNKEFIDSWLKSNNYLKHLTPTNRKFEWQAGEDIENIYQGLIQFRPSGVRVKRPDVFPALVAMVQTPIVGRYQRKISIREAARLQSFPESFIPNSDNHQAYKQLGNAVNVKVIENATRELFNYK